MADIVIPQVGEAVAEVTLVRWFKREGEDVRKGEPLFEVDTDKYVVEIEAFTDGTLEEILVPEGTQVMPLQVVARLANGADVGAKQTTQAGERAAAGASPEAPPASTHGTAEEQRPRGQRVLASPKARRVADELGVDITQLTGTGRGGLVTAEDVEAAGSASTPVTELGTGDDQPLSRVRRAVARRMQTSKQTVPHFYLMVDVEMSEAVKLRQHCVDELGWPQAPSFTDIIVGACGRALADFPEANIYYEEGDRLRNHGSVNVGLAVALEEGLIVPVLRDADRLDLRELSARAGELAGRARDGRLHDTDLGEKSLVVSNLGMHGIDAFLAIIDMPDSMILSAGRVADRCVPVDGVPSVRPVCTLGLSVDHRALDGVAGARFLEIVTRELESAFGLLEAKK